MSIELYDHNLTAYNSAVEMMNKCKKAAVIHPTGTGKSFIAFKLCEDNPGKKICWISPSEYIFKTQVENVNKSDVGFSTDNITFITYSKLTMMSQDDIDKIEPDYIILDEFHRAGATEWSKGVQRLCTAYKDIPLLGLSATNIRYLDNRRDMAEELFDGHIASEMTLGEAIVRGILNPPKYVISVFSYHNEVIKYERKIKNIKNKGIKNKAEMYLENLRKALENADGIDKIFEKHMPDKCGKYIVFCANVEHMREMIEKSREWFACIDNSAHIYSAYSDNPETGKAFAEFKNDESNHLKLLFCIDMLNEGIHVDDVSGVILLRPTVSPIIYKQQIGRALSASKTIDAVIFDIVLNFDNLDSISDVKEEMREAIYYYRGMGYESEIVNEKFDITDEVRNCRQLFYELENTLSLSWESMYAVACNYYKEHGTLLPKSDYRTDDGYGLGQWVITQRIQHANGTLNKSRTERLEKIGMDWRTLKERLWEKSFAEAQAFYDKNKNLNVTSENENLYVWILRQRSKYKSGKITERQYKKLSQIGMVWELDDTWTEKYKLAKEYFTKNGNLDIPAEYVTKDGVNLGNWYRGARNAYINNALPNERLKLLEEIGIQKTSIKQRTWMKYYEEAKKYFEEKGNLNVDAHYKTKNGLNLGVWISSQRYSYSKKRLSDEQIKMLESIGMCWHRDKSRWQNGYEYAKKYYAEHGNINPSAGYTFDDGFAFGDWINSQRLKYKNGKLGFVCIEKLERLGIIWFPNDAAWEKGFEHLLKYRHIYGTCNVKSKYISGDGFKLGAWVTNQRTRYKAGKISDSRVCRLDKIGFVWDVRREKSGKYVITA